MCLYTYIYIEIYMYICVCVCVYIYKYQLSFVRRITIFYRLYIRLVITDYHIKSCGRILHSDGSQEVISKQF